jgi:hypothetical protein
VQCIGQGLCDCGTLISGTVLACADFAVPAGGSLEVKNTSDTVSYGTLAVDGSGHYSGNVSIPSTGSYHLVATIDPADPFAARFAPVTVTRTITVGTSNSLASITLGIVSGYHCSGLVYFPLKDTLDVSDSYQGVTVLLTYNTTLLRWTNTTARAYPGCPTATPACPAAANVQRTIRFAGNLLQADYSTSGSSCPALGAGSLNDVTVIPTVVSTSPFNATASLAAGNGSRWYCGTATTWTITEH